MLSYDGWQKLDRFGRGVVPFMVGFVLMVFSLVPLRLADFSTIMPSLALMVVFYWAVYRPDLLGPLGAFLLGLFYDLITGMPLGMNTLIHLLVYGLVVSQRQLFLAHSFFILWWGYAVVAVFAAAVAWLVGLAFGAGMAPGRALVFQAIAAVALFPLVAWLCGRVQRGFLSEA